MVPVALQRMGLAEGVTRMTRRPARSRQIVMAFGQRNTERGCGQLDTENADEIGIRSASGYLDLLISLKL